MLAAYTALLLTLLAGLALLAAWWHARMTAPSVYVTGYDVERHPPLVMDPADAGARLTEAVVSSPAPVALLRTRYTVQARDSAPAVMDGTHAEARAALDALGLSDRDYALTWFAPGAPLAPGTPHVVAALTLPAARRLARLDVELFLVDRVGRRRTRRIPALPQGQPLAPPVAASDLL